MNKIGQITYCGYNYGSILQTYATQHVLDGYRVETVLLEPVYTGASRYIHAVLDRLSGYSKYIFYPKYIPQFIVMRQGSNKKALGASISGSLEMNNQFVENEIRHQKVEHKALKKLARCGEYSFFISGSDQIWNANWFTDRKDYFLRFAPEEKRVAFAPSFGTQNVAEYNIKKYSRYISEYSFLSVREKSGVDIVKKLTGKDATLLLDPTLLISREEWISLMDGKAAITAPQEKYLLVYFIDNYGETALAAIKKYIGIGYRILVFGVRHDHPGINENDMSYTDGSPWDMINLIKNASSVLTDSFHGAAFSLNLNVPFNVCRRTYTHSFDQSERIFSLLELCGLSNRFIDSANVLNINDDMDFELVNNSLETARASSMRYIDSFIKRLLRQ